MYIGMRKQIQSIQDDGVDINGSAGWWYYRSGTKQQVKYRSQSPSTFACSFLALQGQFSRRASVVMQESSLPVEHNEATSFRPA